MWDKLSTQQDVLAKLAQIVNPGTATPYGHELYTIKQNYDADAALCWRQHARTHNCQDWKADSKRLVPQHTTELRKDIGLETRSRKRPTQTYLCDFCPVKSIMMQRHNSEVYGYNYSE